MRKKHFGSSIDEFLKAEGIFEEAQAQAVQEVVAWQLAEAMKPGQGQLGGPQPEIAPQYEPSGRDVPASRVGQPRPLPSFQS